MKNILVALLVFFVCLDKLSAQTTPEVKDLVSHAIENKLSNFVFESEMAKERESFPWAKLSDKAQVISDDKDDLVVFDQHGFKAVPQVLADITEMLISKEKDVWDVTFVTKDPLPEDPGMPVNFDVFFDRDSDTSNNAPDGVFRAGTDTVFLMLFGTRTKWHAQWWLFDKSLGRWLKQSENVDFTAKGNRFTLKIPYLVIPENSKVPVRGFSLTSNNAGSTAIDVVPGKLLPKIRN